MPVIERQAIVRYSTQQMFDLVNNIQDYPNFLPWCSNSKILEETESAKIAELEIHFSGLTKKFTTQNTLTPFSRIDLNLISGPFESLVGQWNFIELAPSACKVTLYLEFEFTKTLMDKLFQPIFNRIANSLVEAFCNRAQEIYGKENQS